MSSDASLAGSSAQLQQEQLVRTDEGLISARIFSDPRIHELELERIFCRTWLFVAHESEIPGTGDFVTRRMGADGVIVVRGSDGRPRVLLNVCRHRGREVCAEDAGNASHFRCGYHGWTYDDQGQLTGVPFIEAFQGRLDKERLGLREARVDTYHGLIFATWNAEAEPLLECLGEIAWALDLLFGRTEAMEVVGPPMRWRSEGNWKVPAGNFASDGYHLMTTHGFARALGIQTNVTGNKQERTTNRHISHVFHTTNGHATALTCWPEGVDDWPYLGLPKELWPELKEHLTPEQMETLEPVQLILGNLFPNLSFLHLPFTGPAWNGSHLVSFLTVRQWQPVGPNTNEIWSWLLIDKNAPTWWKNASRECYTRSFGMAGVFEQDDMENWSSIGRALQGPIARQQWLQYNMWMDHEPSTVWKGPPGAYLHPSFSDRNERVLYARWQEMMSQA